MGRPTLNDSDSALDVLENVNGPLSEGPTAQRVSYCRVDAAGVPAEWVEAAPATEGQPTIVYFLRGVKGVDVLAQSRSFAGDLAAATGARVFTVACSGPDDPSHGAAVARGIAAMAWLLGEGCDLALTAFTHDSAGACLVKAVLEASGQACRFRPVASSLVVPDWSLETCVIGWHV